MVTAEQNGGAHNVSRVMSKRSAQAAPAEGVQDGSPEGRDLQKQGSVYDSLSAERHAQTSAPRNLLLMELAKPLDYDTWRNTRPRF